MGASHSARWSNAVRDPGFEPNQMQEPLEIEAVVLPIANLTRQLGRFPVEGDFRLEAAAQTKAMRMLPLFVNGINRCQAQEGIPPKATPPTLDSSTC